MSSPKFKFRPLDGLLLLDKPQGMSSNGALQVARRLFRAEKGGHTGSLDPLATGLLPLCFGEATKIAGLLLGSRKAYDTVAVLGTTTDTDDADGAPLRERSVPPLDAATVEAALAPLTGRIRQRAPIYSALKQGGEPLYTKARRGDVIEAPERDVEVHGIEILEIAPGRLSLRVECGSGTYVRSLVRDLGEALGCGAHVGALRRLWVDPFRQSPMYTLEALQAIAEQGGESALDACLLPVEAGLAGFSRVDVDTTGGRRLAQGQRLRGHPPSDGPVAIHGPDNRVLGLGTVDAEGTLSPQRLFAWAVAGTASKAGQDQ